MSGSPPLTPQDRRIWLASASPRRKMLLEQVGLAPMVRTSSVEEIPAPAEAPGAYTLRLAQSKGRAVRDALSAQDKATGPAWVLAADTIVVDGPHILEKPLDDAHAVALLEQLSGRSHEVLTAFWVGDTSARAEVRRVVSTKVRFRVMSPGEILRYVATREPMDKAGAYGIQGIAGAFVEGIEGSYSNVVGLPVGAVVTELERLGALEGFPFSPEEARHV